ncbi:peptidase C14 [Polyporus arcularius HHB13444]|uniref:Peptidase C14 n=1 Tax=Polyporus arcularius HHB13444 TaxID=1314778 RepID=A0A5C3PA30_9APHY|nr:peptidase C14 [Polyporus arcularius HHB13444]
MPSLHHKPTRSSTLNTLRSMTSSRKPVRKGLVVAISYKNSQVPSVKKLHSPHKDARDWRNLMINKYNFAERDITMMLDDEDTPPHLLPTEENIIHEIEALVEGAQPKDRFMFYFAGHSTQSPTTDPDEVDGFDEAIITYSPSGQDHPTIIDDVLKKLLVDSLPVDAFLTAIFDSCHSGTLLDLEHYTCNSAWFPWCTIGPRTLSKGGPNVLRGSGHEGYGDLHIKLDLPLADDASNAGTGEDTENSSTAPAPTREKPTVRIYERTRTGDDSVMKRNTVVNNLPPHEKERRRFVITRASTLEVLRRDSFLDARKPRRWFSFHNFDLMSTVVDGIKDVADTAAAAFGIPRCTSPMGQMPCDGWCQPTTRKKKAQVLSISACQDWQRTWEGKDGWTMTQSLISVLGGPVEQNLVRLGR